MDSRSCASHPDRAAEFRCDGCGQLLCPECIREGHRLLFCSLCGERALPLEARAPATSTGRQRAASLAAAATYSFRDALLYPFRGLGAYAYWGLVGLLFAFEVSMGILPFGGCFVMVPQILIGLLLPGFLFRIAHGTFRGEDELPDWPDFDPWDNLRELVLFVLVAFVALIPMALFLLAFGCDADTVFSGRASLLGCVAGLLLGFFAAVAVWIPAFGATACYETPWLFFRLDLHLRAARVDLEEYLKAAALIGGLLTVAGVLPLVLVLMPLPPFAGSLVGNVVTVYALFLGAHLAGVYFRRHPRELGQVYVG